MLLWTVSLAWGQAPVEPAPVEPAPVEPAPVEPAPAVFNADQVLITTFQGLDEASKIDAPRLFELLSERFRASNDVVPMSSVPAFDVQGYDAATYMLGCPPGRYAGCELVLGAPTPCAPWAARSSTSRTSSRRTRSCSPCTWWT